jgi:hypothetical protein
VRKWCFLGCRGSVGRYAGVDQALKKSRNQLVSFCCFDVLETPGKEANEYLLGNEGHDVHSDDIIFCSLDPRERLALMVVET